MKRPYLISTTLAAVAVVIVGVAVGSQSRSDEAVALSELPQRTHIHGIGVDRADPSRLYLATHHGLFVASPDGTVTRVSENQNDYMGFTPHPTDPGLLYASGHPEGGGNLGVIASRDGGRTWEQVLFRSEDAGAIDLSLDPHNPRTLYAAFWETRRTPWSLSSGGLGSGIFKSNDGGDIWV